ncbi:MAG: hypothetical protein IPN30_06530 [Flavobacteriales bacterium]|nr:hypothetical protein [Flavobacteriales bacterium]
MQKVESSMENFRGSSGGMMSASNSSEALFEERSRLEDERSIILRLRNYCATVLAIQYPLIRGTFQHHPLFRDRSVLNNLVIEMHQAHPIGSIELEHRGTQQSHGDRHGTQDQDLTASLAQTAESLVEQAEIGLVEVNGHLSRTNYQYSQLPEQERQLVNIERKFKLSDNLYNYLMEKRAEAGIAIASDQIDKSIVDQARMKGLKHVSPPRRRFWVVHFSSAC